MAVAPFLKYEIFAEELSKAGHNLATDVFKLALTNTAPTPASDTVWNTTVAPAPAAAAGYPAGGNTLTTSSATRSGAIFKLVLADSVFTASGGSIGPFKYAILYNSSKSNKVIGYYDYGSSITLADTETFTYDADPTNGVLTVTVT
jgi:hypothetical protein